MKHKSESTVLERLRENICTAVFLSVCVVVVVEVAVVVVVVVVGSNNKQKNF